tara:strand:- start:46616 stop:47134 length:519 start_codon:yes stop_codon:yes gene_type:complete
MTPRSISKSIDDLVSIIAVADGEMIGRTRLQKTAYLLELTGLGSGLPFAYKHYGPFSQELADTVEFAQLFGNLEEEQRQASWGGFYSVYTTGPDVVVEVDEGKRGIIELAKEANPISLELAATAAFLATDGFEDPWQETANRKPDKVSRLDDAKALYKKLSAIAVPNAWPVI